MPDLEFKPTPLFGGALLCDLPTNFMDVSNIREVPDYQEVFVAKDGFTSVIIELNQRVPESEAATDEDALKYHLKDIVSDDSSETKIWAGGQATLTKIPDVPTYTLFATQPNHIKTKKNPEDFTGILLVLVRLENVQSDILVSVNVPHVPGEYDQAEIDLPAQKVGGLLETGGKIRQKVLESFEVKDWSVFGEEGKD